MKCNCLFNIFSQVYTIFYSCICFRGQTACVVGKDDSYILLNQGNLSHPLWGLHTASEQGFDGGINNARRFIGGFLFNTNEVSSASEFRKRNFNTIISASTAQAAFDRFICLH